MYLAAPISEYGSARYARLVAVARMRFPGRLILEARTAYADRAEWRTKWPVILASTAVVVFLTTSEGWIGRGVWAELRQARQRNLSIWYLTDRGALVPFDALSFSQPNQEDWKAFARVTVNGED